MQQNTAQLQAELQNSLKQLQQEPHNMKVMSRASDLFFHLGQFENAVKGYQHLLQFQPFNASIFYKLGLTYLRQEDKQAIDTFKNALKYLDPMEQQSKVLIRTKLAKAYKLDEQYEKAKKLV
ncbi:MAG: tetratricopeptide repeat protein, partial [Bacteroidota bacterium]